MRSVFFRAVSTISPTWLICAHELQMGASCSGDRLLQKRSRDTKRLGRGEATMQLEVYFVFVDDGIQHGHRVVVPASWESTFQYVADVGIEEGIAQLNE